MCAIIRLFGFESFNGLGRALGLLLLLIFLIIKCKLFLPKYTKPFEFLKDFRFVVSSVADLDDF
jgi:hypothetical protein